MELQVPYPIINYHQPPTGQLPSIPYSSPTAQPPHPYQTRLDLTILEQNVQFYIQSALSNNTIHSYNSSNRRFLNFCSQLESIHTQHLRPSSANLLDSLAGSTLSTRPLNATSLASDTSKTCSHTMTPLFTT